MNHQPPFPHLDVAMDDCWRCEFCHMLPGGRRAPNCDVRQEMAKKANPVTEVPGDE